MKKIKWGRYILIGVIALFLHYVDFTLGTKTAIIVGLFLYLQISEQTNRIRLVKERVGFLQKQDTESEGHKESSYRLDIYIQPAWFKLYEKALGKTLNKKDIEKLEKKLEKSKDRDSVLWGQRYYFTEYYDIASGITTRFQRIIFPSNGKQVFYTVDEFGEQGCFFKSNDELSLKEYEDGEGGKLSLEIGENFICNNIFDKYSGQLRLNYSEENFLFQFPLNDIFNFLLALGQRFHGAEENTIIKWPDHIEKKFEELGIKYDTFLDYEPELFDIEKHDKEFFEKWGKPKISLYSNSSNNISLSDEDRSHFGVKLKIFHPGGNERVASTN